MDGFAVAIIANCAVTILSIGGAAWKIRGVIDDARAAASKAGAAADKVNTQVIEFRKLCDERHRKIDDEIKRLRNGRG
jgi:hypothetical protein